MAVVVGSDGSDNSVVKLPSAHIRRSGQVTNRLWETLLIEISPRLLGVLHISDILFILEWLTALS